jgi:hypothetical protein
VHIVLKYLADFIFQRLDEAHSNPGLHAVAGEVLPFWYTLLIQQYFILSYLKQFFLLIYYHFVDNCF